MSIKNVHLNTLLQLFYLNALINSPTCYQSHNLTCTDRILRNQKSLFKFSKTFEIGSTDHDRLISATMKSDSFKGPPKKVIFRCYKIFDIANFCNTLKEVLERMNYNSYKSFGNIFLCAKV